ncbi:MAG TPA: lysine--tRNA ligase [Candidatus Saccharimonadia bacterium]|nr:lysine--tRNA ligase [Candidatus Saccharimonadia bacterium]
MNDTSQTDWLDQLVERVNQEHPDGELIVASGHSPSGTYHIGTLREIMTANAITWALGRSGRKARHIDFVDDFDAFRKVPKFVPEEWAKYIGRPLPLVPDPFDCHDSYGAHFLTQLYEGLEALGCVPDERVSGYENYRSGAMADVTATALDRLSEARRIITEVGGRQLDEHWAPVQILDDKDNLRTLKYAGWDGQRREVQWRDRDGGTGTVKLEDGRVKLDWRLDWPARWAKWGVSVEPFGRDHATKGGSYDTGKVLVSDVFGGRAPYPVPYEFINTLGDTKKMSKSVGNVLTPGDALEVMPPEILRYFVMGSRPSRTLNFDSGLGFYTLVDEYVRARTTEGGAALGYARAAQAEETISSVPFNHLVSVHQAAREDEAATREILERTGYEEAVKGEWPVIARELRFVKNWLAKYAPASVKFAVQDTLPEVELTEAQRAFLAKLAHTIEAEQDLNGQGMHDAIYAAAEVAGLKAGQAFVALYRVILGQDSGPKAGWFLASLDHGWLLKRLREAGL